MFVTIIMVKQALITYLLLQSPPSHLALQKQKGCNLGYLSCIFTTKQCAYMQINIQVSNSDSTLAIDYLLVLYCMVIM